MLLLVDDVPLVDELFSDSRLCEGVLWDDDPPVDDPVLLWVDDEVL